MEQSTNQKIGFTWVLLFGILFIVFLIAYINQRSLRLPPRNHPSGINDCIIDTCKCQSTQVEYSQKGLTVIVFNSYPNRLSICRYIVGQMKPGRHKE